MVCLVTPRKIDKLEDMEESAFRTCKDKNQILVLLLEPTTPI
jgi:hypothetical protein